MSGTELSRLRVHVEYGELKMDFEGTPQQVTTSFLAFLAQIYPAYEVVSKLTLTVDLEDLLRKLEGVLAFTPEGGVILVPREKLKLREHIGLHLIKAYVGRSLGKLEKDSLSVDELLNAIGGRIGAMAGRLSEMVDEGLVIRVGRGEYKITTFGIKNFSEEILPNLKSLGG